MILVDTSVWVEHLKHTSAELIALLEDDQVLTHSFVIGELALSGLINREEILDLLEVLPRATEASHQEALEVVHRWSLDGRGIGWVDTHLLAAALLSDARLLTLDTRLATASAVAGVSFGPDGT